MKSVKTIGALIVTISLLALAGMGGLYFQEKATNYQLTAENKKQNQLIQSYETKVQKLETQSRDLETQINELETKESIVSSERSSDQEAKEYESTAETDNQVSNTTDFQEIVTEVFTTLYDFTPKTFKDRQEELVTHFSKELVDKFFNETGDYTDSNGVTSEIEDINIYVGTEEESILEGLVRVKYKSKLTEGEWNSAIDLLRVSYNTKNKQIVSLETVIVGIKDE